MKKAILFDLDGTLLPINEETFTKTYFKLLSEHAAPHGYEPKHLTDVIWNGTKQMYLNTGEKTNEQVFWDYFCEQYGENKREDKKLFDEFYLEKFNQLKFTSSENPYAKQLIDFAKNNFEYVIIATNPIFPENATFHRLSWLSFKKNEFDLITAYENSNFSKPNPNYFKQILNKFNLLPEDCIMIGNDELEDYFAASSIGIETYLVGDNIISNEKVVNKPKHYTFPQLLDILKKHAKN